MYVHNCCIVNVECYMWCEPLWNHIIPLKMKNESCVRWKSWDCEPYCFHYWSLYNDSALSTHHSFILSLSIQHCRPMNSIISFSSAFSSLLCYYSIHILLGFNLLGCLPAWLPFIPDATTITMWLPRDEIFLNFSQ